MKIIRILILILIALVFPQVALAASPSYSLRPRTGQVRLDSKFYIDILINSADTEVAFARASIKFDPEYLEVIKAERNESLFCEHPEDEQAVDNDNGLVMVTGYCQSGSGDLYETSGDSDVFARVRFQAKKIGKTELKWQYSGEDEPFMSVQMEDGSPPLNILEDKPKDGVLEIVRSVSSGIPSDTPTTPVTGVGISIVSTILGIMLITSGFFYIKLSERRRLSKLKTVVVYDKK